MPNDNSSTLIGRVPVAPRRAAPQDDLRWVIPPLIHEHGAPAAAGTPSQPLPGGYRLGEHIVVEARGPEGRCERYVVTHSERGSLHLARVLQAAHAAAAPALLEAARRIQQHPQRNLLKVIETGWTEEATPRGFIVHERLVGRSLASLLAGRGGVEWPLVLAIGLQCAEALEALHLLGLAHTDLKPQHAALMHVAGDQFRVVLGGLDHAQTIQPGACAAQEPRVREDLDALATMLAALAACSAAAGSPAPSSLSCLLTRMVDPRPALRPTSAGEIHDQLGAVRDHLDPDLSGGRMLGEAFRKLSCDDFEVEIEASEALPARVRDLAGAQARARDDARAQLRRDAPPRSPAAPRRGSLLLVGLLCFVAGASLRELQAPRRAPITAQAPASRDEQTRELEGPRLRPEPRGAVELPVVTLPRCEDQARPTSPPRTNPPRATLAARIPPLLNAPEVIEAGQDEPEDAGETELLPVPIRGAASEAADAAASP